MTTSPFLSSKEACDIILNPGENVCTEIPHGCRKDVTFVLDTSCFNHNDDFKADDNGSSHHHDSKLNSLRWKTMVKFHASMTPKICQNILGTYQVHSSTKAFKRRTITLQDHVGEAWPVIILQYLNTSTEEDVKVEPHKNAKKSLQPFYGTATSTKQHITDKAKTPLAPSSIYDEFFEGGGSIVESTSFASLPRGIRQVKYQETSTGRILWRI